MSEFKFSCPHCSQSIGCDEGYAGRTIQCPACGGDLVVPAQGPPPGYRLMVNRPASSAPLSGPPNLKHRAVPPRRSIVPKLALFALPVVALTILLVIIVRVSNHGASDAPPNASSAGGTNSAAGRPQASTDLQKVEQAVREQVQLVKSARSRRQAAINNRNQLHATYHGQNLPRTTYDSVMKTYQAADNEINNSDTALAAVRRNFETVFARYQQLGGKTDYREQLEL